MGSTPSVPEPRCSVETAGTHQEAGGQQVFTAGQHLQGPPLGPGVPLPLHSSPVPTGPADSEWGRSWSVWQPKGSGHGQIGGDTSL